MVDPAARAALGESLEGIRLGRYRLGPRIAKGGMGEVYLATTRGHAGVGKVFAVKTILRGRVESERAVKRFIDEARTASRIDHPNVCAVLDFGEEEGIAYLVMEYLHGAPLSALMRNEEPMPLWLIARVIADAARGLDAAHELSTAEGAPLGIVHRDVSPQNLFVLYDGPCKVLDFGVARARDQLASTMTGSIRGKLGYISPEMAEGLPLDRRADIWALGVVLHECLRGKRLFRAPDPAGTFAAILQAPLPDALADRSDAPAGLRELVDGCLERDPERRIGSAGEVAERLERVMMELGERADHARVAAWIAERHAAEIEERKATLAALRDAPTTQVDLRAPEGSGPATTPSRRPSGRPESLDRRPTVPLDRSLFADELPEDLSDDLSRPTTPRTPRAPREPEPGPGRALGPVLWIALGVLLGVGATLALVFALR